MRSWLWPRWLLATVISTVVVMGATGGVMLAGRPDTSLPAPRAWKGCAVGAPAAPTRGGPVLLLADDLAQPSSRTYVTLMTNLASHFGPVTVRDSSDYTPGMMARYRGTIYLGIADLAPAAFVADVHAGLGRVLWMGGNADHLAAGGAFEERYGWLPGPMIRSRVRSVVYKNVPLSRAPDETEPLRTYDYLDPDRLTVLARVEDANGRSWPWAVRSANLTYVGELALQPDTETDRYLAVADLLFDLLAAQTPVRHRALVRLEDIGPEGDPAAVRAVGKLLSRMRVPFSFGVYPVYRGPLTQRPRQEIHLRDRPLMVRAITYLLEHGGTMVLHGYSHQSDDRVNPTNGESGADFEFFRTHWSRSRQLVYDGPMPGDSARWTGQRLDAALAELRAAHLPEPRIMEPAHYGASPVNYRVFARKFAARFDRGQYFTPGWQGREPATPYMTEQYAPYLIRDVYKSVVIPETLGFVRSTPPGRRAAQVAAIAANARAQLVVRDNVAGFFYHPFLGTAHLKELVDRLRALGYQFVSPCEL